MRYQTGGAFRRALEQRLRDQSLATGVSLVRLRKMVTFDRFLARLFQLAPQAWVVKGGLAIQLRLGERARTTKDIDLLALVDSDQVRSMLQKAGRLDLGDYFYFTVAEPPGGLARTVGGVRYPVHSLLDGRTFDRFHLDVGTMDPMLDPVEYKEMPGLLAFADIPPAMVSCFPVTQQIAEKFHAYTRPRGLGENSRVKDLMDIILLAQSSDVSGERLYRALQATFEHTGTHPLPDSVPPPPQGWKLPFRKMARDVGLEGMTLDQAHHIVCDLLDHVLSSPPPYPPQARNLCKSKEEQL